MREPILKYYNVAPDVTAFSTTRHGGFSVGDYASFNINPYCGDTEQHIFQNKEILCRKLAIRPNRLIMPHQTHGCNIGIITEDFLEQSSEEQMAQLENVDAIITAEKQVCIGVSTADCVPILLYDSKNQTAAAVHAGWRGTQQRIVEKTIQKMCEQYASCPQNLKAVIGPSISLDAFEVGDEVYRSFEAAHFNMQQIASLKDQKWHINLWEANVQSMLLQGMERTNIEVTEICTYMQSTDFFSARKLTIKSGRIFTGIILR